ncbi:MAG TPA: 50S ribosomal protein L4 [Thermodesulfobacteriota bacterium]|jgi:large subunit ribosomal protein L4e
MITKLLDLNGIEIGDLTLPMIFETPFRPEIIRKVYANLSSSRYQPQGRYAAAGEIVSAESRNTGLGIARLARAKGEGFPRAGQAAGVAGVRHGRVAHPPVSLKVINKKINKKEKILGFCSAIAATAKKEIMERRGHKLRNLTKFPLVVVNEIEDVQKASELENVLLSLNLQEDLARAKIIKRVPSGKSRMRGRKKRTALSALVVVGKGSSILKLRRSLPGVHVKPIEGLSVLDLAPGANPIRLTIYSARAIESLPRINSRHHKIIEVMKGI